jgi:transketolase
MTDPVAVTPETTRRMANAIRALAMDAVQAANSGHPGMPMGMADVATVLFSQFLKFDPRDPKWPDRDRFVLSAGHGSMLLYSILHLTGYQDMPLDALKSFRQLHSPAAGHPEYGHAGGIETTTGPLGQGIATAVGMALAERHLNARFGDDLVDHRTYVIASDGDLMEGISHEAISLAGHLKLNRLIVLFDDNGISIDGPLDLSESGDQVARFQAAGWNASRVDGHDPAAVAAALKAAQSSDKPVLIACKTVIGYGAPKLAGTSKSHGSPLGAEEIAGARAKLGWDYGAFEIPGDVADAWSAAGRRGATARSDWTKRLDASDKKGAFEAGLDEDVAATLAAPMAAYRTGLTGKPPTVATRKASEMALEVVNAALATTVGGSADLTGSNNTLTKGLGGVSAANYGGRYVYYGVREHGMAAAMNGMALHGGIIPYSGTFLAFADYCRPAIRLAALMGIRVIHVMTHDSIGLGEDGPTHQPVEQIASLRAIPNLLVFRPCDAVETAEAWEVALSQTKRPSVIALTRQNLAPMRLTDGPNLTARGGYVVKAATAAEKVALIATGSEVEIAAQAQATLEAEGIGTRLVSLPSWELFNEQDETYRASVLPEGLVKVAVEAASPMGWDRYIGPRGAFVGMTGYGASAPYQELYRHFGLTPEAVAAAAKARL